MKFQGSDKYVATQDLMLAVNAATALQRPLLIKEIDKADIEFPNDLLREIDRMEFYCYETREMIRAKHRPLVFITSNNEKELPDAFLRRCFFHYINLLKPSPWQEKQMPFCSSALTAALGSLALPSLALP